MFKDIRDYIKKTPHSNQDDEDDTQHYEADAIDLTDVIGTVRAALPIEVTDSPEAMHKAWARASTPTLPWGAGPSSGLAAQSQSSTAAPSSGHAAQVPSSAAAASSRPAYSTHQPNTQPSERWGEMEGKERWSVRSGGIEKGDGERGGAGFGWNDGEWGTDLGPEQI